MREYGERIGFHTHPQKNMSELVYDSKGGSASYLEADLSLMGISDEQLIVNVVSLLKTHMCQTSIVPWPPHVAEP